MELGWPSVLSEVRTRGSSLQTTPQREARSWARQFYSVEAISKDTVEDCLQAAFPAAGGVSTLFLKGDQPIMATTTVEFPESLCSREWCITEVGVGIPKSTQMLPGLKWYFLIQLPRGLRGMLLARRLPPLSTQHKF